MDWNILLFIGKWVMIGLFYTVLMVLLVGVYRESAQRVESVPASSAVFYGRLRVVDSGSDRTLQPGKIFDLHVEASIGSEQDNDIVLKDQFVSRRHARMFWDGAVWWLEDLGSRNGTLINNQSITPNRPNLIPAHALITVGNVVFEVY
jgi:hypothetical protein